MIVTKSPLLRRLETFIQKSWINLEYVELSHLGDGFARVIDLIMNTLFKVPRNEVSQMGLLY